MIVLAIDPGDQESAYAAIDLQTRRPLEFDKIPNADLLRKLRRMLAGHFAIEMISSYGMPVGREVFETCVWIGRFQQVFQETHPTRADLVLRREVKLHHTHTTKATDANISAALKDRFASGVRNHGKGTKAEPGWFYGFSADVWQAYALAVQQADVLEGYQP